MFLRFISIRKILAGCFVFLVVFLYKNIFVSSAVIPTVVTNPASQITKTSAQLNGNISNVGDSLITEVGYEYGLTTSYGNSIDGDQIEYRYISQFGTFGSGIGQFNQPFDIVIDSLQDIYVVDAASNRVQKFDSDGSYTFGFGGTFGSGNGQFAGPRGIELDSLGNIYVTDSDNNRVQKFDSNGNYLSQFGTAGSGDGEFDFPEDISIDEDGNIYVTDSLNHRVQKFDSNGNYLSQFGSFGSGNGQFSNPAGIDLDLLGNIYVVDTGNNRVQKFDPNGNYLSQFGSFGTGNGQFNSPSKLTIDVFENIYVTDTINYRIQKFDPNGNYLSQFGSFGTGQGQFIGIQGVGIDSSGSIYATDANGRIQKFSLTFNIPLPSLVCGTTYHYRAFAVNDDGTGYGEDETFSTLSCTPPEVETDGVINLSQNSATLNAHFLFPQDVTSFGFEFGETLSYGQEISDTDNPDFFEVFGIAGAGLGEFSSPTHVDLDSLGNIYVADTGNGYIQKFDPNGNYLSQFGAGGSGDGEFNSPAGLDFDSLGNIYVVDYGNGRVQKFDSSGVYISQFGTPGSADGEFSGPSDIVIDDLDNIYVVDSDNGRVQKFDSSGVYISQFGTPGSADGEFSAPWGIGLDSFGDIYVADTGNGRVQKFDPNGNYLLQFGTSGSGDGELSSPVDIIFGLSGDVYIVDSGNHRVQKFDSDGNYISKFGTEGDQDGEFLAPWGIAIDPLGNIYIVDSGNNRIQKFNLSFSMSAQSLRCGTTYHYRAFAVNDDGSGYGDDQTFSTEACDQVITEESSSSKTGTTAYARFRNLIDMGKYEEAYAVINDFPNMFTSEEYGPYDFCDNALFVDFMKMKDVDGNYSAYNNGVVKEVSKLQTFINKILVYQYIQASGPVDGIFGPLTKIGVERLQNLLNGSMDLEEDLDIDGIVGPYTRSAVNDFCLPGNFSS